MACANAKDAAMPHVINALLLRLAGVLAGYLDPQVTLVAQIDEMTMTTVSQVDRCFLLLCCFVAFCHLVLFL